MISFYDSYTYIWPHLFPLEVDVAHMQDGGQDFADCLLLFPGESQDVHGCLQHLEVLLVIFIFNVTTTTLEKKLKN